MPVVRRFGFNEPRNQVCLSSLPRYQQSEEVECVIASCDRAAQIVGAVAGLIVGSAKRFAAGLEAIVKGSGAEVPQTAANISKAALLGGVFQQRLIEADFLDVVIACCPDVSASARSRKH